jgi:hypothetical protein
MRNQLRRYLEQMRAAKRAMYADYTHKLAYDGVEDFLLQHGTWYEYQPLDKTKYQRGAPKSCFGNAIVLSYTMGLRYVEGLALIKDLPMAVLHAWNLDADGNLVDNTWVGRNFADERAYIGVEFSPGRAENAVWFDDCSVLDNYADHYALFQNPWTGEDFNKQWRESDELRAIRKAVQFNG